MDELRALGALLSRLGAEAGAIQKNATAGLSELDTTLHVIDEAWNTSVATANAGANATQQQVGGYSLDVLKLSNEFAEEVVALARQTMMLTRELRAHMAPFRFDQTQGSDADLPMYVPGTP